MSEQGIRDTNRDACIHKGHCVAKGYWEDPFVGSFIKAELDKPNSPLINRGYWARITFVWKVVQQFLTKNAGAKCQVVNIGCGWDTTYFRLHHCSGGGTGMYSSFSLLRWVDVDFPETNRVKRRIIAQNPELRKYLGDPSAVRTEETQLFSPSYCLLSADLRKPEPLLQALISTSSSCSSGVGLDPLCPTLVISECVLVYLLPEHSDALLQCLATTFQNNLSVVAYEPVNPDDAFGKMMVKNLEGRGCPLLGIQKYPTLASQKQRYERLGFTTVDVADMNEVYGKRLPAAERSKVERIELLDEVEEWSMLLAHYAFVVASHDSSTSANFADLV